MASKTNTKPKAAAKRELWLKGRDEARAKARAKEALMEEKAALKEERRRVLVLAAALQSGDVAKALSLSDEWARVDGDDSTKVRFFGPDPAVERDAILAAAPEEEFGFGDSIRLSGALLAPEELRSLVDSRVGYIDVPASPGKEDRRQESFDALLPTPVTDGRMVRTVRARFGEAAAALVRASALRLLEAGVPFATSTSDVARENARTERIRALEGLELTFEGRELDPAEVYEKLLQFAGAALEDLRSELKPLGVLPAPKAHPNELRDALAQVGAEVGMTRAELAARLVAHVREADAGYRRTARKDVARARRAAEQWFRWVDGVERIVCPKPKVR